MSIFIAIMYVLGNEFLRGLGLGARSSWATGVTLLADHVVLQEVRVVLELFLELRLFVSWILPTVTLRNALTMSRPPTSSPPTYT